MTVSDEGRIGNVFPGMPAAQTGLAPGLKLIAVGGRAYSADRLQAVLTASKSSTAPLEIIAENGKFFQAFDLNYHGGLQSPHLGRGPAQLGLLPVITSPLAFAPKF